MSDKPKKHDNALLRVCASCEWIFKVPSMPSPTGCPKCGFAHYSARYVYDDAAYRYQVSQKPWYDRKMKDYSVLLQSEIEASKPRRSNCPPAKLPIRITRF